MLCFTGFSLMNDTALERRNHLQITTLAELMFVNLNGLDIGDFDPIPFVKSWIGGGGRLLTSWKPGPVANLDKKMP
jgi:hypothetical protein